MKILRHLGVCLALLLLPGTAPQAGAQTRLARLEGFERLEFSVDGVTRVAFIYAPANAKTVETPLVFVFHGHGGTAGNAVMQFRLHREWPEAISVYMQGLPTPGALTDPEGKRAGWQGRGGGQGDRDLKFFDAVLARLKTDFKVDARRIYATGHSNGGLFSYVLWAERGDVFAAFAPSAAAGAANLAKLKPKPALHIAGEKDELVKFVWQQRTMDAVRKVNGCETEGTPWDKNGTLYPSKTGTPFVACIHPGAHNFLRNAPQLIVKFFKEHPAAANP